MFRLLCFAIIRLFLPFLLDAYMCKPVSYGTLVISRESVAMICITSKANVTCYFTRILIFLRPIYVYTYIHTTTNCL
jgi:hypothetical protein